MSTILMNMEDPSILSSDSMTNERMRQITGEVDGNSLEGFLYLLLRDHLTAGTLEKLVCEIEGVSEVCFTNGHLGQYAKLLSTRLVSKINRGING